MTELSALLVLPFAQRAMVAGVALAVVGGVLGVFIVLRGMSFFSDAIAHASLLGVALALVLALQPFLGAMVIALLTAAAIALLRGRTVASFDTLIGVFFSAAVALAVIVIGFFKGFRADLLAFLFGDILALQGTDVLLAWILSALVLILLALSWRPVVLSTLHRDLASVEGVRVVQTDLLFLVLVALVVAVSIKIAGVILVSALLIVPAAAAQNLARSFRGMVVWSIGISLLAFGGGIVGSFAGNLPSGPTIVLAAAILFALSFLSRAQRSSRG